MAILKGQLQADNGDVLHPHTSASVVFGKNGKSVEAQIDVLGEDRGYLQEKHIRNGDANNVVKSGQYFLGGISLNIPVTGEQYHLSVITLGNGWLAQEATMDNSKTAKFFRVCGNGNWTPWKQIATTDKTNILCTPKTGYKMLFQSNYRINNVVYYNLILSKSDGKSFAKNTTLDLCTMPLGNAPLSREGVVGSFRGLVGGLGVGVGTVEFLQNGSVYVVTSTENVDQARISGTVVL